AVTLLPVKARPEAYAACPGTRRPSGALVDANCLARASGLWRCELLRRALWMPGSEPEEVGGSCRDTGPHLSSPQFRVPRLQCTLQSGGARCRRSGSRTTRCPSLG